MVIEALYSANRLDWLKRISEISQKDYSSVDRLLLSFGILPSRCLRPWHIVSIASLVEKLNRDMVTVALNMMEPCGRYLKNDVQLPEYWKGHQDYAKATNRTLLNLWRVKPEQIEDHAVRITDYLKNSFFKNKDLSAVSLSLLEAYYNIIDHSDSKGNAYSMLSFDESTEVLNVAVCDFGIGIAGSVRNFDSSIKSDVDAVIKATQEKFTVGSRSHNAGLGLSNIRSVCTEKDNLWIISNSAAVGLTNSTLKAFELDFNFPGTLLSYNISLSHFEDEENVSNEYNW